MDNKNSPPTSFHKEFNENQEGREDGPKAAVRRAEANSPETMLPSLTELSEDEMGRHEIFHQAVKQILTNSARKDHKSLPHSRERKPQYTNLLTQQELQFLLR